MKRKTKIIIYSTCILLILLIMLGFTYGYFITKIDGNKNAKSVEIVSGESKALYTDLTTEDISEIIEPGYTHIKLFTVQNIGNIRAKYSIYLTDVINTFNRKEDIKYTLYRKVGNNTIDTSNFTDCDVIVSNITYPSSKSLVKGNEEIVTPQSYYTYALKITYINSTENQNIDQGKKFSGKIQLYPTDSEDLSNPYSEGTLSHAIINSARNPKDSNSTTWGNTVTEFTSKSGESERVLNSAPDDYGISYYFRGNVLDNNVTFAGKNWKIVRINGDGSIRLVLDGSAGESVFNTNADDNAYVGYMYGLTGQTDSNINQCVKLNSAGTAAEVDTTNTTEETCVAAGNKWAATPYDATHTNVVSSTIKTTLENWYKTNIVDTNNTGYIADTLFCNDKTLASNSIGFNNTALGYGKNKTYYASDERLESSIFANDVAEPIFECAKGTSNTYSRFTVNESTLLNGNKTNGDLTYSIGLLTEDEVTYAGFYDGGTNESTYLNISTVSSIWVLNSPYTFNGSEAQMKLSAHDSVDYIKVNTNNNGDISTRPVINLKASVLVDTGDGTSSNPYTVKLQ